MADPLDPILPGAKAKTEAEAFLELRRKYRAENLRRVRALNRDTELSGIRVDAEPGHVFQSMEEYLAQGGEVPQAGDTTFNILPVPQAKLDDLAGNAEGVLRGEQVRHAGNPTGDQSREGPPLESMDEESILAWTAANVTREGGLGELNPHLGEEDGQKEHASAGPNDPTAGTGTDREVPTWNQSPNWPSSAGEGTPREHGPLNAKYIVQEGSAQASEAFRKFWSDFERKGSPPTLPESGPIPRGSTIAIPPEVAFSSSGKIWFAGRGPFRSPLLTDGSTNNAPNPRAPTNPSPTLVASALWWRLSVEAVRHFIHGCWDRCREAVARWRGRQ